VCRVLLCGLALSASEEENGMSTRSVKTIADAVLTSRVSRRAALIGLFTIAGTSATRAADKDAICVALSQGSRKPIDLHFKVKGLPPKRLSEARLDEIAGRTVHMFCTTNRGNDLPSNVPLRSALSVKIELLEPDASNDVQLYNNHRKDDAWSCKARDFTTYQAFHSFRRADRCLSDRFHNPRGDFSTLEEARRRRFLFPTGRNASFKNWLEKLQRPEPESIRRMSHIYNHAISETIATCIHFKFDTSRNIKGLRITVDDLLEDAFHRPFEPLQLTVK